MRAVTGSACGRVLSVYSVVPKCEISSRTLFTNPKLKRVCFPHLGIVGIYVCMVVVCSTVNS